MRKLQDLIRIDSILNRIQDIDILLERILLEARTVTGSDAGTIYIREGNELVFKYSQNETKQKELGDGQKLIYKVFRVPINEETISGYVATNGIKLNIPDMYSISPDEPYNFDPYFDNVSKYKSGSSLTIPLLSSRDDLLGVLQLLNKKDDSGEIIEYGTEDELFSDHFGNNVTVALERAHMTRLILLRMITMAELRDPKETGAHVNRVASYSTELYEAWAVHNGIEDYEREHNRDILRMAAILHDVGKVGISDLILKKPGKLTADEYDIMKTHTIIGAALFRDSQSELDEASQSIAVNHHENWDGTGYPGWVDPFSGAVIHSDDKGKPRGKKGTEIPLFGRIVAIADVFDALSCKRVYKEAWKEEDVLNELSSLAGTKFDPELIQYFLEIMPSIRNIQERFPDS